MLQRKRRFFCSFCAAECIQYKKVALIIIVRHHDVPAPSFSFSLGLDAPAPPNGEGDGCFVGGNCCQSAGLSMGDHPAAPTLPATNPVMSVAAPRTELERDRIDLDLFLESGVAAPAAAAEAAAEPPPTPAEPKLSSRVGVAGALIELDRECDGLLYLGINVSRGCFIANFKLLIRPPLSRFRKASSSRTSANGAG